MCSGNSSQADIAQSCWESAGHGLDKLQQWSDCAWNATRGLTVHSTGSLLSDIVLGNMFAGLPKAAILIRLLMQGQGSAPRSLRCPECSAHPCACFVCAVSLVMPSCTMFLAFHRGHA